MSSDAKPGLRPYYLEQASDKILEALETLRFGSIEITVHDGRIVQIERREKVRFEKPACPS